MKLKQLFTLIMLITAAAVSTRAAQVDYLFALTVDDDPGDGESLRQIEVSIQAFEWGLANPLSIGSSGGGAGAGKVQLHNLVITKSVDANSGLFFSWCATGQPIKKATLTIVRKNKGKEADTVLTTTFNLVLVAGYRLGGTAGPEAWPVETIELAFASVQPGF